MDNFVHVCALAAVSSLCEVLLHYAMNALGARAMSYSSLNSWNQRHTWHRQASKMLLANHLRVKLSPFCLPTTDHGEGMAALSPLLLSPFRTYQNENDGGNQRGHVNLLSYISKGIIYKIRHTIVSYFLLVLGFLYHAT